MDVEVAVRERRSIRMFRPEPIPEETVGQILAAARWSPSWGNTQPWHVHVVTGEPLARFKRANRENCLKDTPSSSEIPMPEVWPDIMKHRYVDVGRSVLTALSIARGDTAARKKYYGDMFNLFNAPCMILVCLSRDLMIEYAMLDVGLLVQTICLVAHGKGIGSCILAASVGYPSVLREIVPIPEGQVIVIGMAMGYPDRDAPINNFERKRAGLDEWVTWVN